MLANALRDAGHHVTFLTLHDDVPPTTSLRPRLRPDIPVLTWERMPVGSRGRLRFRRHQFPQRSGGVSVFPSRIAPQIPYVATLHGGYETVPELITKPFLGYLDRLVTTWLYTAKKNRDVPVEDVVDEREIRHVIQAVPPPPLTPPAIDVRRRFEIADGAAARAVVAGDSRKGWDIAIDATRKVREATASMRTWF